MPLELKDYPRPPSDNGRGLHGASNAGWSGGVEGYDYWIGELVAMGIKWFKVLDDGGNSLPFCEKLIAGGIFPIVRLLRRDPPPNNTPEPNPGHIGPNEEQTLRNLVAAGVRYFETNNEPDLSAEWKHNAMPSDALETAKLVALNWLFDARLILDAGGLPGIPAVSSGSGLDLLGALVSLGRQDILGEGCWIALHNYGLNHPLNYPDDPVNRTGKPLNPEEYDLGLYTEWAWWNNSLARADTLDEINAARALGKNPTLSIPLDHACFREFEYYNAFAMKYVGRSIPILSTEGGYWIGRREDARYPRLTPEMHRDRTVEMFDYMQREAPDYCFAATPWLLLESAGRETDAWNSSFWQRTLRNGSDGRNGIPPIPVSGVRMVGEYLPVVDGVKGMPNVARRLPGTQPAPPVQARPSGVPPHVGHGAVPAASRPIPAPKAGPSSSPIVSATAAAPLAEEGYIKYVALSGDTLSGIAKRFGATWQALAALNKITTPYLIRPGQALSIPLSGAERASSRDVRSSVQTPTPDLQPRDSRLTPGQLPPTSQEPAEFAPPQSEEWAREDRPSPFPPSDVAAGSQSGFQHELAYEPTTEEERPAPARHFPQEETPPSGSQYSESPAGTPVQFSAPIPRLDWDPRLDALGASVEHAHVEPGEFYWKLVFAEYQGPAESGGRHHIYYVVLDERGAPFHNQKVWQVWPNDKADTVTNEAGEANLPLWAAFSPQLGEIGPYSAWVEGHPSDRVHGLGMPQKNPVCFVLKWQRTLG